MGESRLAANQQGTYSQEELIWLAGFMDGEGSIHVSIHKYKNLLQWHPGISVSNTDMEIIEYISGLLHRMGVGHHVEAPKLSGLAKRYSKNIQIKGIKRVSQFLPRMLPYFRLKSKQAHLMWELIRSRAKKWEDGTPRNTRAKPLDEYEVGLIDQIRELNHSFRKGMAIRLLRDHERSTHKGEDMAQPS